VTKAKGLQGCKPRRSPWVTSHTPKSVKKCEEVWGNEPSHSQGNFHFGRWSPNGVPKLHRALSGVATPLWGKCEVATHTPENGTWESSRIPENSERNCRGQNTLHWGVLYIVEKVLKCRCPKWPHMSHLDICSTSYGQKKGRESNWQFDSRPLKVGNWLDSGACRWSATHCWKDLKKSYNFGLDLVPIRVWGEALWMSKIPGVPIKTVSGLHFGSPGNKSHLDASAAESYREYYMGKGGGFPRIRAMVSQVSPR
jgi:hypothetical protein